MPVIPAPYRAVSPEGSPFLLGAATPVAVDAPELAPLVAWFRAELATLTGIALTEETAGDDAPGIRLALVPDDADPDLAALPLPAGLRSDDGDAGAERHALTITADGITVRALAPEGIFRGLTTLLQLAATSDIADGVIALPATEILDAPRFAWRGLSFDVVRCAFAVDEVKRVIDLLALYKANTLHLHLTDSEGWRIQIDAWPKLTEVSGTTAAAGRPGLFYTKDDYREIVRYAADRFITVIPEIEMPGHTAAIFAAYPELAGDGTSDAAEVTAKAHYFQAMNPDNPRVIGFFRDVLAEVAAITPGPYLHFGGDEALGMDEEQYERFMRAAMPIVGDLGKKLVGWQEVARAGFAPGQVAQLWISATLNAAAEGGGMPNLGDLELPEGIEIPENAEALLGAFTEFMKIAGLDLGKALDQGARILLSDSSVSYLDTKYREDPVAAASDQLAERKRLGMPFYPRKTVAEFFQWDPSFQRPELSPERMAGIEAAIWCESVASFDDLLFLLLPRLPGLMEKGWSPETAGPDFGWAAYAPRLAAQAGIWETLGLPYFRSSVVWDK
ncbi:MAG: family 20 glycosylhydrolase [Thermomicrobiales bacterium]